MNAFKKHKIVLDRSSTHYENGYISGLKLGDFLAIYNATVLLLNRPELVIPFRYTIQPDVDASASASATAAAPIDPRQELAKLVCGNLYFVMMMPPRNDAQIPSFSETDYARLIKKRLDIAYNMTSLERKVVATYTGLVMHGTVYTVRSICEANIINKPLAGHVKKIKTSTASFYKEFVAPGPVKINLNLQGGGGDFFIRGQFLSLYTQLAGRCLFTKLKTEIRVSNQCAHIRGLQYAMMNIHTFRSKLITHKNVVKMPSFPGLRLLDPDEPVTRPRDNIIHREAVLCRIHKSHDMVQNINLLADQLYPVCERLETLHDAIFEIEHHYNSVLNYNVLGLIKMCFLFFGETLLKRLFIDGMWIDSHIIAQNGETSRAPMCHEIRETSAIKNTSIKSVSRNLQEQPPIVNDPDLLSTLTSTFGDVAAGPMNPKIWKKRGAFNYISVLMQAPTKAVNSPTTGQVMVDALIDLLNANGGRDQFPDTLKLLSIYRDRRALNRQSR